MPRVFGIARSAYMRRSLELDGEKTPLRGWALILGASSGFGEATALFLAREGLHIFGVHLDRRATLENVERIIAEIKALGREAVFFNVNAADAEKRQEVLEQMEKELGIKTGANTPDLKFTLDTVRCVGACALGPMVIIGEDYHGEMTPEKVSEVLKSYS
jgi:NAD(P)-dependent dehydrogenase (short-subunit alcohol dehydrogenase family)